MSLELLEVHVKKYVSFTDEELAYFSCQFVSKHILKKELVLRQGEICRFEAFVVSGCFRLFNTDREGNEHVLYFAVTDWWITDIDSFTSKTPAYLTIQAMEDSEILLITKEDKEKLYVDLPKVEKLFRIMTQKNLVSLQRRLIRNHSSSAEDRYLYFVATYPEIAKKLTNLQIAAYLGITHEFVSKIRSKIYKSK